MSNIIFCGDTFLLTRNGKNPFSNISSVFHDKYVCINLETSLIGEKKKEKNVCLCVNENHLEMIPESVGIISLVNNHVLDSGDPAKLIGFLERKKKTVVGPKNPTAVCVSLDGKEVEFFSAYYGLPLLRTSYEGALSNMLVRMLMKSRSTRKVVNLHWGYEHTDVPAPFQRKLARNLIDAGADIIIGHHPHVPQGWEVYKGKYIYYSLGNFNFWQFDGEKSDNNRWGYMVEYDHIDATAKAIPYQINEDYQPCHISFEDAEKNFERLQSLNGAIGENDEGTWFRCQYAGWYKSEMNVWKRACYQRLSPTLWGKWLAWLCTPMQMKYRIYALRAHMKTVL